MKAALPVVELLEKLVSFPSISGSEAELVAWLASYLEDLGLQPVVAGRNVWVRLAGRSDKLCLLFNSHFDVVPPGVGWDSDPFVPARKGPHLVGRGANDAKGSVAAMIAAVHQLAQGRQGDLAVERGVELADLAEPRHVRGVARRHR